MSNVTDTYYALDAAIQGYGAQIMVGDGASPESFEAIAAVTSITPGEMSTADILRTHLRSPARHQEHAPGLRDSGAFELRGKWLPNHESQSNQGGGSGSFAAGGLIKLWRTAEIKNFQIVLGDGSPGTVWPFRGYVAGFQPGEIVGENNIDFLARIQPTEAYDTALP